MSVHEYLLAELCQISRQRDDVADLPTVNLHTRQLVDIDLEVIHVYPLFAVVQELDEVVPDVAALLFVQIRVSNGKMDTGLEGFVKGAHPVCCEDEDTIVVL